MEQTLDLAAAAALLAAQRMAWLVADQRLQVQAVADPSGLLSLPVPRSGERLADVLPELVGSEPDLEAVRCGDLDRLEIDLIQREDSRGRSVYVRLLVAPDPTASTGEEALFCILEDITERGATRQRLMQSRNELLLAQRNLAIAVLDLQAANAELRRLTDLKSVFVSVAAHELRTPLAVIISYADLLAAGIDGDLNGPQLHSVDAIRGGADRLLRITSNLLDLARIEAGRLEVVLQVADLGELVAATVEELRGLFRQSGLTLTLAMDPDLPLALVDALRTKEIVSNLLSNAQKYTPPGGSVSVSLAAAEDPGELALTVRDTGVGIAPEEQPAIGSWMFRASSSAQINAQGAGLGLYITRSLVELHGGRLWFESAPGVGSAFHVTFLAADGD